MSENLELRIRITADGRAAIEGTRQVESQIDRLGETAKQVGGLIAAYLSFEFLSSAVQALFQAGAALQDFQTRFQALAGSQQAAAAEMAYVQNAAQKLGIELNTARESYAQLLAQQQAGVITQQQARDLLEGFGRAAQMTGAGSEQVKQAMLGLSQALSSGKVSTEDFRQAVDPLPGMMKHVADAMGVSIGELKENLAKGKVGSADFAQAMIQGLQEAGKGAQDFGTGLSATWQRVKNEWTLLLEAFGAADFLSGSFNDMAGAILSTLEQTLKDASAFIQSGWLSDAFAAEVGYITGSWSELGSALADDQFFRDVANNWATLWNDFKESTLEFSKNFATVFSDLPEIVAGFTVIAASTLDQWIIDANAGWELVQIAFSAAWAAMQGWLAQILADMSAAVARAAAQMAVSFTSSVSTMAAAVADIPGVGDVMVGIVQQLGQARTAAVEWATTAQQGAAEVQTANAETAASYADQAQAVREAAAQQKVASEAAAQQTVLELHARTEARDAAIAKAQADRQAAAATQGNSAATAANSAAQASNAAATDKAAKAKQSAADRIAEQSQKLVEETAGLQRITQAYLTFNDALVAQTRIENQLAALKPELRDQARAKAIAELNAQVAQKLYDLEHETQLLGREMEATLQGADALALFAAAKQAETILRERNTGALEAETAQIVEHHAAAAQLLDDVKTAMKAYKDSLSPQEQYANALEEIAKQEARLKAAGKWTAEAARGLDYLRQQAEQAAAAADPMATAFQEAAKAIYDGWNGFWEDLLTGNLKGFSDFGERIEQFFLKLLAQLAAAALAKPILLPVIQLLGGSIGLGQAQIAAVANNLFGAGSMVAGASGASGLGGLGSLLSSGFGLFGGGGIGSLVGGAIGGLGSLLGGTFGAGLSAGGSLMSGMGLLSGGASALGVATNGMVGAGVSAGLIASTVIPVVGAVVAALVASGVFKKEPHPSSFAIAGSYPEGHGNLTGYHGKGDWITGESGLGFGYAYGHTDPKAAQELRDSLMQVDAAMAQLIPNADMAGVALGGFGQTAEGFVAGLTDTGARYVASMDEVFAWFVRDWVAAAAEQGAVSQNLATIIQAMAGSAEEIIKGLGGLLQIEDYIAADPLQDFEAALASASQTAAQALATMRQNLGDLALSFDGTSAHAEQLGAASVQLYQAELAMIEHIRGLVQGLIGTFADSVEQIQLGLMSDAEKYTYYWEQAQAAQQAMAQSTDPDEIARLAEQARQAAMEAYSLATAALEPDATDEQRAALGQQFIDFLNATQQQATDQLNAAEQQVVDQHRETAQILQDALIDAAAAASQSLEEAGQAAASAISGAAEGMAAALAAALAATRPGAAGDAGGMAAGGMAAGGMAAGGWVGGRWNGQSGIAGDTVLTALTPGEAVIPRAQAQRHAHLINSLIKGDVRYAAGGVVPTPSPPPPTGGGGLLSGGGDSGSGASPQDLAAQLADFMQGISRTLRDLSATDYAKQINSINDALEDNLKRAAELGASEEQLAAIRELAQKQLEALDAQRAAELADLMQSYQDAAAGYTPLQQALLDNQRATEEAVKKAQELGATEEQLALTREVGAQNAQQLQDQQAAQLADLMRSYQDAAAGYTPLQQALLDNQRATDEAVKKAQELGATEEQLALIREVGAQNAQQLQDQQAAQLADLMRSYQDAAAGYTPLQQALLDNQRATDEAVKKAQELGATEAQLALIRVQGQQQAEDLAAAEQKKIDDFNASIADQLAAMDRTPQAQALADLESWYDEQRRQAEELGADVTQIDALYARKRIDLAEQAQQKALQAYREGVAEAIRLHDELTAAITQARQSGAQAMLGIRRQQTGWNEAAYQAGEVEDLRRRLRAETDPTKQVELIRQLQDAIGARYQAEVEAINATSSASQTKSELEIRNAERTRAIVENIRKYLDSLNLSQLSPLTPTQRLAEAARQYQELLARAQAGDATAGDQITQAADAYLQEARSYYASSGAYTAIFDQVRAALEGLTGVSFADPVQAEAEYRSTTVDLQTQSVDLQSQIADAQAAALSELAALDDVLKDLQADADDQLTATIAALEETLREETDKNIAAIAAQSDKNAAAVTVALDRLSQANETALQNNATAVAASMGTIITTLLDQLIERINVNSAQQANTRQVA